MEALNFDNIWGEQEINGLFEDEDVTPATTGTPAEEQPGDKNNNETEKTTEVVTPESLFEGDVEDEQPESVGSEKTKEVKEDTTPVEDGGTSPNENFYSSMAIAMAEDGIFPNLDEETISKVVDAETLSDAIEAEVNARLDEKQQRIAKALENGVEPTDIKRYEGTLQFLNNVTEKQLIAEDERGEQLRWQLIYQSYINSGSSPEKAKKLADRSVSAGNDIEDAKDALADNKEYFQKQYENLLKDAQEEAEQEKANRQKQEAKLKKDIMEDKQVMGDIEVSQDIRKKAYDYISKPVYKDPETGQYMTALQKYEMEHHADFMKLIGLTLVLTNEGKDFDSFTKGKVKKETRKGLAELERKLRGNISNAGGSFKAVNSRNDDPESFFSGNLKLAL